VSMSSEPANRAEKRDYTRLLANIPIPQHSRRGSYEVLLELIDDVPPGRVLDAPCGPGLLSEALRQLGHQVTAGDLRADGFVPGDIPFFAMDLDAKFPFDDCAFDLVICGDGIEHLENPFALFREFSRVLADGGALVVATPNYLNLERRLKFLWSGSMTKPLARTGGVPRDEKPGHGHINPLTLIRMAYMAESSGLDLVRSTTALRKPRQFALAPLALAIRCFRPFLSDSYRRDLFVDHTLTMRSLLGGKVLLAVFRKSASVASE
jgi:2-polyprenyl-3-methyl-5-hydroxy-6-metoxy-1,4-benzoquinol methylase